MDLSVWSPTQRGCHSQSSAAGSLCDCPSACFLLTERLPWEFSRAQTLPVLICSSGTMLIALLTYSSVSVVQASLLCLGKSVPKL